MSAPGITSIKSFKYRGAVEEWGNSYHFVGDAPSDRAGWVALAGELATIEKIGLATTVTVVRMYCYEDLSPGNDSVYTIGTGDASFPYTGALTPAGGSYLAPGDAAGWIRWKTARVNTHGKPIYLRKYYHGMIVTPDSDDGDAIESAQLTALGTVAADLSTSTGAWPGIAGPDGVAPGDTLVTPFVTTRTLRRRGRRPS